MIKPLIAISIIILAKFIIAILIAFYSFLKPFWALPEDDIANCVNNVESWYNVQAEKINDLPLSQESKIAGVESYRLEANKQLRWFCDK